jgi:hypothetical protein
VSDKTTGAQDSDIGERIERIAQDLKKSPAWLRDSVEIIARLASCFRDLPDDRPTLPEFVYRH